MVFKIQIKALNNLGNAYGSMENYDESIDCFSKSVHLAKEIGNRSDEAIASVNLGYVIKLQKQSLEIARDIGDRARQTIALLNLGAVYGDRRNYETAEVRTAM
jgi:tetratricopeptide (TPR) repeat protein